MLDARDGDDEAALARFESAAAAGHARSLVNSAVALERLGRERREAMPLYYEAAEKHADALAEYNIGVHTMDVDARDAEERFKRGWRLYAPAANNAGALMAQRVEHRIAHRKPRDDELDKQSRALLQAAADRADELGLFNVAVVEQKSAGLYICHN